MKFTHAKSPFLPNIYSQQSFFNLMRVYLDLEQQKEKMKKKGKRKECFFCHSLTALALFGDTICVNRKYIFSFAFLFLVLVHQ